MNRLLTMAFSAILCMGLLAVFFGKTAQSVPKDAPLPSSSPVADNKALAVSDIGDGEALVLERNNAGQFHVEGKVNGTQLPFLIDTGADVVALTTDAAQDAGIFVDPTSMEPMMQTASGTGKAARVTVNRFEIAGKEFENFDVVVMEGLQTNLLGQSVLRQLGRIELKGDRMVIERN
jgi:aspartyl protease family protein